MATGLNPADFVNVSVTIEAFPAQYRSFGNALHIGSSPIIDTNERIRLFTGLDAVAQTFGTTAPEYFAAAAHFGQSPQPQTLYIGRWAQTPTSGLLHGAVLSTTQQLVSNFSSISNGSLVISIDGTARTITGINLTSALNLNAVANLVQTAIAAVVPGTKVIWGNIEKRFTVISPTTGPTSSVSYGSAAGSGTDLSALLHLTSTDASPPVIGVAAESLITCVANMANISTQWYALEVFTTTPPADSDHIAVAQFIEASTQSRIYGINIQNSNVLDSTTSLDLGSALKTLNLKRTFWQYSSNSPYAVASLFGRAATVDFNGSNTTITLAYKQEPGIAAEYLTENQFATLKAKNGNVFVNVNNGTAVVFPGSMANGYWFDEVHGTDWLQNEIQTDVYNLLYQTPTKVPQTDAGMNLIKAVIQAACQRGVNNGLIAPGVWTGPNVGQLKTGDTLTSGFYVYAPPVASQSDADRAARKSVSFQVAIKLAGAVHTVLISVLADR